MSRLLFSDFLAKVTKEDLLQYYIVDNHTIKECCAFFELSQTVFMRILKYYDIKKPLEAHTANIKRSKLERFGDPNFNNRPKADTTNLQRYGVKNQFQRVDLFPHIAQIRQERYGSYNNIEKNLQTRIKNSGSLEASYKKQNETYRQTCLAKYGIDNVAKLQTVRDAIANSLKETFLERYGVENYWDQPDAKRSNGSKNSKANLEVCQKLAELNITYQQEFLLGGKWFDFKIDNYLLEINPSATHNSTWGIYSPEGLDVKYHKQKSAIATAASYHCIHKFDWDNLDKILNIVNHRPTIYARKCELAEISAKDAVAFLNTWHLQGYAKDRIRLGLKYEDNLVAIMTFGKPRYNKDYEFELIRYCSPLYNIVGGGARLFKQFIRQYDPRSIISYCDISKFTGNIYKQLGFKYIRTSSPARHWYNIKTKVHITDNLLRQQGFDRLFGTNYGKGTSNEELMLEHGFVEIYDCGQATYSWHKQA